MSSRRVFVASVLVCLVAASSSVLSASTITFTESLAANPFSSSGGNFSISNASGLASDAFGQFTWDGSTSSKYAGDSAGSLKVAYDSSHPTVRLERPLPTTLGMNNDFSISTRMTIRSAGLIAPDDGYCQIAFGLTNHSSTGGVRTDFTTANTYNQVEFNYFPNVAFWGGPTLQETAFGSKVGSNAFGNFASPTFSDGDLSDNTSGQIKSLPLDTPLDVTIAYTAANQYLTMKVSRVEANGSLTQLFMNSAGVMTLDLSGAGASGGSYPTNNFDKSNPFSLDTLAITTYYDYWPGSVPSLHANLEFDQFSFSATQQSQSTPEPVTMLLMGSGAILLFRRRRS